MYKLKAGGMKWLKVLHLCCALSWVGGGISLLVLNLAAPQANTPGALYGLNLGGHLVDWWVVVVPGAFGCFLTGFAYSLLTAWGFTRHKWIIFKWLVTLGAIFFGTFFLGKWEVSMLEFSRQLDLAALNDPAYQGVKLQHLGGGLVQVAILLFTVGVSVFKPWRSVGRATPRA